MTAALNIKDESTDGKLIYESVIQFPAENISVEELIRARVKSEVNKYNQSSAQLFQGLIQPKESEIALNGFKTKKKKHIDEEGQVETAIYAFLSNGFFLLVNDRQLTELDDEIIITPNTSVVFLKLIPLVGG